MSGGWQVGDLALCVSRGFLCHKTNLPLKDAPKKGEIYLVASVESSEIGEVLRFSEFTASNGTLRRFLSVGFRKIKPDAEPCEEEFTVLIKRMKPAKVTL